MLENPNDMLSCPLAYTVSLFGGKWKPYIIWYLSISPTGFCRYGALKKSIPYEISHKVMAQQLKELEHDGIINRTEFDEVPPHVEYSLTEKGVSLARVMYLLRDWGVRYGGFNDSAFSRSRGHREDGRIIYDTMECCQCSPYAADEAIIWALPQRGIGELSSVTSREPSREPWHQAREHDQNVTCV